jgi:phytanoyl-CoA hydroxylase
MSSLGQQVVLPGDAELESLREQFERDGFVNGGRVLDEDVARQMADEMEWLVQRTFIEPVPGQARIGKDVGKRADVHHYHMVKVWQTSERFRQLIGSARITRIVAYLTRSKLLQLWTDTVQYKPPARGAHFEFHQDAPYHAYIEPRTALIAAWIALDDATEENGCMWMVPGSHRWGRGLQYLREYASLETHEELACLPPPRNATDAMLREWRGAVPRPLRAGEVHFHHALTWHASPVNRSSRRRCGYTCFYMPDGVRVTAPDFRKGLPVGALMRDAGAEFPVVYDENTRQP